MKAEQITYYKIGNGYVGITNQSPKGLKGLVFVGKGSEKGIESISEQCYAINQIQKMEKISAGDVPDDWFKAIGYEQRMTTPPIPEFVVPKPNYVPIMIEFPGDDLRRRMLAKPGTPEYDQWQREKVKFWSVFIASVIIVLTFYFWIL